MCTARTPKDSPFHSCEEKNENKRLRFEISDRLRKDVKRVGIGGFIDFPADLNDVVELWMIFFYCMISNYVLSRLN